MHSAELNSQEFEVNVAIGHLIREATTCFARALEHSGVIPDAGIIIGRLMGRYDDAIHILTAERIMEPLSAVCLNHGGRLVRLPMAGGNEFVFMAFAQTSEPLTKEFGTELKLAELSIQRELEDPKNHLAPAFERELGKRWSKCNVAQPSEMDIQYIRQLRINVESWEEI